MEVEVAHFFNIKKITNNILRVSMAVILAFSSLFFIPVSANATGGLNIVGGTTVTGLTDGYIAIPGLTLAGTSSDPAIPVSLSVPRGQLSMTTTTGLTFTGSQTGTSIAFQGSQSDLNAALATLRYRTTRAETVQLTATLTSPGVVFFPGNGHMYEVINHGSSISWDDAKVAAEGLTKNGATGYLATITSQAENDYLLGKLIGDGWFGATDAATEDDWQWATGPEAGTSFWQGLGDGSPVGGLFSNWSSGEPNNAGDEDCAQFYSSGSGWNDLPCSQAILDYYVVEYGTDGNLPMAPSSTNYTITTSFPAPDNVSVGSCLDLIDVVDNASDHRYDNLSLTGNIDCTGETIEPMFNETDPDLGTMGFRGTFDGNGHTISNITVQANDNNTGLIASTDGATIEDLNVTGSVTGGENCLGGLVGRSLNTTFNNINIDVDVSSSASYSYGMGGIVGCLDAQVDASAMTNSSAQGSLTGYARLGGIVGDIEASGGATLTMTGNTANALITSPNNGSVIGGLVGEVDTTDEGTTLALSGNSTPGISISNAYQVGGLVGELQADDGSQVTIEQNSITGGVTGNGTVGGLLGAGYAYDGSQLTITNFTYTHDVVGANGNVGGVIGEAAAEGSSADTKLTISNSSVSGAVSGQSEVGGMLGTIYWDYGDEDMRITNSHTTGDVTGQYDEVGGIAGSAYGLKITSSYASGDIETEGSAGGLIGEADETVITKSYASGNVTSTEDGVGGLVGKNGSEAHIIESYATGNVHGVSRVGGLAGANGSDSIIRDSYARGTVTGDDNVGGLVGRCGNGVIESSYATGAVTGNATTGGLLGHDAASCAISDSFWDAQVTTQATSAGSATGKTTTVMKAKATFTDTATAGLSQAWNFSTVWGMNNTVNNGYACLLWQANNCGASSGDTDQVSQAMEDGAPNGGDANNDTIADSEQSNVASFINSVTQNYVSLELDDVCQLTSAGSGAESGNAVNDEKYTYLSGLVNFSADCGTPGYTSTITQHYYGATLDASTVLRKYNPVTKTYFTISGASLNATTIGGLPVVIATYTITDGELLDIDGQANGTIVDPAGLATLVSDSDAELAATGENTVALLLLGVVLVAAGVSIGVRRYANQTK